MSIDWFLKLKEIDSLRKMRFSHLKGQSEQDARLSQLNLRRHEKVLEDEQLKSEYSSLQQALFETEQKLKTASTQLEHLREMGGEDRKCQEKLTEIERWETEGFSLLEKIDQNVRDREDIKTFLKGLGNTIKEIAEDVAQELGSSASEVGQLDLRIRLLTQELPLEFQTLLAKVTAKNLAHGPFTRVEGGHCFFCRFKLSRLDESEIDMQKGLKTCNQCGRIFLPLGAG